MKTIIAITLFGILNYSLQAKDAPQTNVTFKKVTLLDQYITEGASIADLDADGNLDIIAGSLWWKGPDFKQSFAYAPVKTYPIKGYAPNFFTFPDELTQDKWVDIIKVGLPSKPAEIFVNPAKEPWSPDNVKNSCECHKIHGSICNESPQYLDVIGNEQKELLFYDKGKILLARPTQDATKMWDVFDISGAQKSKKPYVHGLGAGDINGDHLQDILEKDGWWEQPKDWDSKAPWTFHKYAFAPGKGGAQMFAYDVDGDGDNDVVTALDAHAYGMAWHEQITVDNKISFKAHTVMTDKVEGNPYGVCFSQLHAMECADIDGDGIKDIITGKCYYAHKGKDPGAEDPAVLYWFKTQRHADGSAEFIPYLIDDNSGVGRQVSVADINKDGKMDIVIGSKKGVFAFIQK